MTPSLSGRRFVAVSGGVDVGSSTVFTFTEDRLTGVVTASYAGGSVLAGSLVGQRDGSRVEFRYSHVTRAGAVESGISHDRVSMLDDGRLRLDEAWEWTSRTGSGTSVLEELPGPRYVRSRVARPSRSLASAGEFYGGLLGLPLDGPHTGTPYDVLFVALPGGAELELTAGGPPPTVTGPEDLLVLYLASSADVRALVESLPPSVARVTAENPYWQDYGVTVLDPDGYRVVLTSPPGS